MKLYVGNLPYNIEGRPLAEADIHDHFAEFGSVGKIEMIHDRDTGQFRGFAFVEMLTGGIEAIAGLNQINFGSRRLEVNEAKPRVERPRGRRG